MKPVFSAFAVSLALGLSAYAAEKSSPDITLSLINGYDSNIYNTGHGALKDIATGVTSLGAKVGLKPAQGVVLNYQAGATNYWDASVENHSKQTLDATWSKKMEPISWKANTEFSLVSGDDDGVYYGTDCAGCSIGNAFSTAAPREHRDQLQNKTDLTFRFDQEVGFVRAIGKLQHWDMQTSAVSSTNYVDRYDIQGGLDVGRSFSPKGTEYYLGYRRGYQFQDNDFNSTVTENASNHYTRYLIGMEGAPVKTVKVSAQLGLSEHCFGANYKGRPTEDGVYADATLTWALVPSDELQFKASQASTFSTTGRYRFILNVWQIGWKHEFSPRWSASLMARLMETEYAPAVRDDLMYSCIAGLTWKATDSLSIVLNATSDWGRNFHNAVSGRTSEVREFDRLVFSAGVNWKL